MAKEIVREDKSQKEAMSVMEQVSPGMSKDEENLLTEKLKKAYEMKESENFEKAVVLFEEIMKTFEKELSPGMQVRILIELAYLNLWLGHYRSAEVLAQRILIVKLPPDQSSHIADTAYTILTKIAIAQFDFKLAKKYVYKIADTITGRLIECVLCLKLRDLKGAESAINRIYRKCEKDQVPPPDSPEFRLCETFCMLLRGNTKDAVSAARRLKKKCENDPVLLLLLAEIFMTGGAYADAYNTTKSVEKHFPDNDQVHAIYSHVFYAEEDFPMAEIEAEKALKVNPSNHYAKTILVKLLMRQGKYQEAADMGKEILEESPEYSLGHANLGDVYFVQGKYDLARTEYSRTEALINSKTRGALLRQARVCIMDDRFEDSIKILEPLTNEIHTYYDDAMCDLALCYEKTGEKKKKAGLLEKMQLRRAFFKRIDGVLKEIGGEMQNVKRKT